MECQYCEDRLSAYLERTLFEGEMRQVSEHLDRCGDCAALLENMRSLTAACRTFPILEPGTELLERILLRTSGRPRTRSLREVLDRFLLRPLMTPRLAVGASLAALFLALLFHFMVPRVSAVAAAIAPGEVLRHLDRGVQQIYSEGVKVYDKKNEWQAQITFIKNNLLNKLGFMIEQLDVPVEGNKDKSGQPRQQQEKDSSEKSSALQLPA